MTDREYRRGGEGSRERVITETRREEGSETMAVNEGGVMGRGAGFLRGLSWAAIFGGAFVALATMIMLNLLGVAIGAATLEVGVAQPGLTVGAGIWWVLSFLIALFFGGWVAGRVSDSLDRGEGIIHGVVTWALVIFASAVALTTALGAMLGGAFNVIGTQLAALIGQADLLAMVDLEGVAADVPEGAVAEAQAQAIIAAEQATDALAAGAGWAFVALILGLVVAGFASLLGSAMPPVAREERSERTKRVLRPRHA